MDILIDLARLFSGFSLQFFPFAYLCIMPFGKNMRFGCPRTVTYILIASMALIFCIAGTAAKHLIGDRALVFQITNGVFMIMFALCIAYYSFLVKAPATEKIFIICFVAVFAFFVSLITTMLWHYYYNIIAPDGFVEDNPYSVEYTLFLFLFTAIVFPIARLIMKKHIIPLLDIIEEQEFKYMAWLSALLLGLLSAGFAVIGAELTISANSVFMCLVLCAAVGSVYAVSFIFLRKIKDAQTLRINLLKAEHINNMAQEQYKHICENIEAQKQASHNFRQQLITLRGLCDNDERSVREYLSEYLNQIPEYSVMPVCSNTVLNSIMSYYKSTAESEHFKFDCHIDIPPEINISDVDLVTILGNLLENALEAGRLLPKEERYVIVNIGFSHKMLGITVDNRFDGTVDFLYDHYASTKHKRDALGIMSVKNIAQKYRGSAVFEHKGDMFYSSVMLTNLQK